MDIRMYIMTHKEYAKPEGRMFHFLHVGRAIGRELGYEGDDTGDNISSKNKNYCELTGLYWVWKNVKCDVVGTCHYRRYFIENEDYLSEERIAEILRKYDIIVPESEYGENGSIYNHYASRHNAKDLDVCRDVISRLCPEYLPDFDACMSCSLLSIANMLIAPKAIYDEYCSWLFGILFEAEKYIDINSYDEYQARVMGFLSERLFRVWLMHSHYRIYESKIRMMDPADSDNAMKAISLKYRYVGLVLKDITDRYKSIECSTDESMPPLPYSEAFPIDFCGKTPVWIFWAQGLDSAPDLVKICINSVLKNLPSNAEIHLITFENVFNYISLPEYIIQKVNNGTITITHFSDILRAALLYRYGGLWLDATYYLTGPLPRALFFDREFFTQRLCTAKEKTDVSRGRWAGNILASVKHNILFRFMLEAFYEYWKTQDKMIDYYLIDHVTALAYDNISPVRNMIDSCPVSMPHIFDLQENINCAYNERTYNLWTKDTCMFKLSYKTSLVTEDIVGRKTYYGKMLEDY